jgi:heme-degrading monooxygenase HmoA
MYARVIMLTGLQDIDAAVAYLEETALPAVRAQNGYEGLSAAADRSSGRLGVLTLWATAADREASNSALSKVREEGRNQLAADMTVETFDQQAVQIGRRPEVGNRVLVTRISMDPSRVKDNVEYFKSEVMPQVSAAPGFRTLRNLIDPDTGEGIVSSIWDDEQSLQAALEATEERRAMAASRGVTFGERMLAELVFVDLK